jgi:hypothetical protein
MKEDVLKATRLELMIIWINLDSEVLLMKIKAIIQRKSSDTKTEQVQHEFNIGKFHLNSKLRFWLLMMKNLLNYLQKKMSYLKC